MAFPDSLRISMKQYLVATAVFWTVLVSGSCFWTLWSGNSQIHHLMATEARSDLNKDLLYRRWAASHGGVYVPVTRETLPSPYLSHIKERDISTPSGRALTLLNPAYMTRQVHTLAEKEHGVQGHITSLNPLRSENVPDPWERGALQQIAQGESEVVSMEQFKGEPHLRVMRLLRTEKPCLKCHAGQGYKEGDVRGGISVSVPLAPYRALFAAHSRSTIFAHVLIWLVGLAGLFFVGRVFSLQLRRQAELEEARRRDEEWLYLTQVSIDSAGDCVFWIDEEARFRLVNETACHRLGYSREEFSAMRVFDIEPLFPREKWAEHWRELMHRGAMIFETVHRAKDGAEFPVEVSLNRIACGEVVYGCAFARDISERKQAEQALTQVAREWSAAMDASDDVIYILDLNRHLVRANKAFYLATGMSPETAVGRHIMELFHPKREPFSCPVCLAQEERRDLHLIMEADSPENLLGSRPIEVISKMVRDQDGRPLSILTTLHDLTAARQEAKERGRLEKQLQQAQKMEAIGTLAGGVAHDFNNILTPILGYTEMALARVSPESETAGELKEVFKAAKRAAELVRQILAFSRQGDQQLQPLKVQLIIKEALKLLRSSIPTSIEFRQRIDPECGAVLADPTQIHQIIMNLCTNAYHAMRETGGVLGMTLSQVELGPQDIINKLVMKPGRYLMLEVSDTGHGMSKAVLERVFEPYFTTKGTGEGTGLGLAVVHGIVKKLAGEITVYSEPGKGTNFHVYLPVLETEAQGGAAQLPGLLPRGSERILVVDDEEVVVRLLQDMLGGLGYQVSGFTTPEEALAAFRTQPQDFDLILTDMTMPRITGDHLAREVLALRPGMPVMICTGFSELLSEEKARALNIRKMLMKPVLLRELALAVREVLQTQEH